MSGGKIVYRIKKAMVKKHNSTFSKTAKFATDEEVAQEIYDERKEIGLFTLDDIEIDLADVEEAIGRTHIKLCNVPYVNWTDALAEAIVNKNPIKIKAKK